MALRKEQIGAQLYTLREYTKTLDEIERTLARVRQIGYEAIQISGFGPVDPEAVGRLVGNIGLNVAATHVKWPRFLDDLDAVIAEHQMWACSHAAIGGLPKEYYTPEGISRFVEELEPVVEKLNRAGIDFSYHNHNHELVKYGGKTWLKKLYEAASPDLLKAEIDVYWITAGGGDPAAWIRDLGLRQPLVHLKDMIPLASKEQNFAEVGEGNLNWPAVFEACQAVGVEYYLVEQDKCYDRDPFDCMATSFKNLVNMGFA